MRPTTLLKMRIYSLLTLTLLLSIPVVAQKHDYNWVMGYFHNSPDPFGNIRIDFNYQPPKVHLENLKMNFDATSSVLSDSSGSLLYYTNGIRIFNKNHQLMQGGDTINPGHVWESSKNYGYFTIYSTFSLPLPNASNIYYLFHSDLAVNSSSTEIRARHLYYSIIDMNANNGLGKVIAKNQVLLAGEVLWPSATKHGNGRDWWIMGMISEDTKHYLFKLSPEGISGPFIQDIGPAFTVDEFVGQSIFDPNGRYFLRHDSNKGLRLYDFDRCSGLLSNLRIIPYQGGYNTWFATFSPNSRYLYLNRFSWLWSIDMEADDLSASFDQIAYWDFNFYPYYPWTCGFGLTQLGPDGRIYWMGVSGSTQSMSVMHRPNLPADVADAEEEAILLPRWVSSSLDRSPNYRLGEWNDSPCDTINAQKPDDGFVATNWFPQKQAVSPSYTILSPIKTPSCDNCTEEDFKWLNDPMGYVFARYILEKTGNPPANWPTKLAERDNIFLVKKPTPTQSTFNNHSKHE